MECPMDTDPPGTPRSTSPAGVSVTPGAIPSTPILTEDSKPPSAPTTPVKEESQPQPQDVQDETLLKYRNAIARLNDPKDSKEAIEMKKLLQELNNNLEAYLLNAKFNSFFMTALPIILQYLNCGAKNFIKEHNDSHIRQLVLELLSRFPLSVTRQFLPQMFPVLYNIMESDNEDNACIAFRILVDLHKRIQKLGDDLKKLLQLIKKFTLMLMQNAPKILESCKPYHVRSMEELDLEPILQEIFIATSLQTETVHNGFTLLPRGINSLKLLTEVPINVIMLSQIYRGLAEAELFELLQMALKLVVIQPTPEQRANEMFNLEIYTDFLYVQIKFFSYVAFMARSQEEKFQSLMVGEKLPRMILTLFKSMPDELTSLRKDLLYSTRYIVSTRFRNYFAPYIEEFFDETVIIGKGWTTNETLRSFAYSVVYDLVHHLRDSLRLKELNLAVNIYSKNLYDDSLSLSIHIMSCRLLLNISDSFIKVAEREKAVIHLPGMMLKILEIFTNKICLMAKYSIPNIKAKLNAAAASKAAAAETVDEAPNFNDERSNYKSNIEYLTSSFITNEDFKLNFGIPEPQNSSIAECRMLARTLLNGLKALSTKLSDLAQRAELSALTNSQPGQATSIKTGYCRPRDIYILIRLFKKGIKLLEIFNMNSFPNPPPNMVLNYLNRQQSNNNQMVQNLHARTKEEKDAIEMFSSLFTVLAPQTFRVVIKFTIDYFVECIRENCNIQQLAHCFLSNKNTSPVFANILTAYLVERMEIMGKNTEISNLFLKLFKLVFGSVALFPLENERMLQPHLRKLVNNSMQMAMTAQEPYNYFMILRALFRSIGGGSHDQLYQEFLPMLPSLLQGLNNFQTGIHRQNMKDLFVELCLTIPVRLSSLLPYLPWLMDPLVSALNGAPNLISQGLRTLELCVDNLQPDFLYEHIQPIRIELMQSLWRTLRYQSENIAQVSFRILGKLGGTNHRMMIEPQKLEYIDFRDPLLDENERNEQRRQTENPANIPSHGTCAFMEIKFEDSPTSIHLPVDMVIEAAYRGLRLSTLDPFYRQQCWEVVHGFLLANMQNFTLEEEKHQLKKLFSHSSFSTGTDFGYSSTNSFSLSSPYSTMNFYKFPDEKLRKVHVLALTAMFTASAIKETSGSVISFMVPLVRHYTMVAICQQAGPINISGRTVKLHGMDPLVLIDAIKAIMCEEERELCKPCHMTLRVIIETTVKILGSKDRACQLPLYDYILERICALCYERAWYSKYNGCFTVRYLFERMSLRWLFGHQFIILKAMLFVIMDLSTDLSSGVIEMAKDNLETIVKICGSPLPDNSPKDLVDLKQKSMTEVIQELLRQIQSSNTTVRQQVMHLLEVLGKIIGCTVTDVIRPHKELLDDMVPFKKQRLFQLPVKVQIGILDGNTFCITLEPQLFVLDTEIPEHSNFFDDVYAICDNDDQQLVQRFPCYKNVGSLTPVRKAALRMLSACHYLRPKLNKIFHVLYKALMFSQDVELQECAYDCMEKYKYIKDVNQDQVRTTARASLGNISEIRVLTAKDLPLIHRLKNLARLFPCIFNDKLCEHMLSHLNKITDLCFGIIRRFREFEIKFRMNPNPEHQSSELIKLSQLDNSIPQYLNIGVEIIYLFCEISAADTSYVESLLNLLAKAESLLDIYVCMTYYKPIQQFMKRYPKEAIDQLEQRMSEDSIYRFFLHVLQNEEGQLFRAVFYENPSRLVNILSAKNATEPAGTPASSPIVASGSGGQSQQQSPQQVPAPASTVDVTSSPSPSGILFGSGSGVSSQTYARYQAIKIVHILIKHDDAWLSTQPELVKALKSIWLSEAFHAGHQENFIMESKQWEEPRLLVKCLLNYLSHNRLEFEMYFQLLRAFIGKYHCDFEFLREFFANDIAKKSTIEWRRNAFLKFCELFRSTSTKFTGLDCSLEWSQELKAKVLKYIIIPTFSDSFKNEQTTQLLGPTLDDDFNQSNQPNLVSIYLNVLVKDLTVADSVRILLIQLGCLIVEHASNYIRPPQISENERIPRSKRKNAEVRQLVEYAWPGMHATKRQDTMKKYYCHLLLTHIISKISIHKDIIRQVFLSLLKGYYNESRAIVFNALEILIPVLPQRIKDGYRMLRQLTKKLLIEESHSSGQLTHLLHIIVRYYRIYYPTRHTYVPHMVTTLQRFGLTPNSGMEQRKLALDLVEVIIRWEHERISAEQLDKSDKPTDVDSSDSESSFDSKKEQSSSQTKSPGGGLNSQETRLSQGSIEKEYSDTILQFLMRFICSVNDFSLSQNNPTQANLLNLSAMPDFLCRRALNLLKDALQNEFWPLSDIKLGFLERLLMTVKDQSPNFISICMALELLILFLETLKRDVAIQMLMPLQKAIFVCCQCINPKVVSTVHNLLTKMMAIVPPSCHSSTISPKSGQPVKPVVNDTLETFEQLYTDIHSLILNGFMSYNKNNTVPGGSSVQATPILNSGNIQGASPSGVNIQMMNRPPIGPGGQPVPPGGMPGSALNSTMTTLSQLFSVLMCLKAACLNEPAYIDRLSTPFSVMLQKLVKEHVTSVQMHYQVPDFNASLCADIINLCLELIKNRIGALNHETRRILISHVFTHLIEKSPEVKVMKTLLKIFEEWIKQPMASTQSGSRASSGTVHSAIVPVLREKTALMQRIGQNIEKRFGDDLELHAQYLELIHYIYSDDTLKSSDMANKLEFAFMSGLRCSQPQIRQKFFALLDNCLRKRLYDRLMHIVCSQNWDMIGAHYWIRQAIELILAVSDQSSVITSTNQNAKLPLPTALIPLSEHQDKSLLTDFTSNGINSMVSCVPTDIMDLLSYDTKMADPFKSSDSSQKSESSGNFLNDLLDNDKQQQSSNGHSTGSESRSDPTQCLLENVCTFLWESRNHKSWSFFNAMAQLCHFDIPLAHHIWIQLFPRVYSIMNERQQILIALETGGFIVSGVHQFQRDAPISSVNTFFEAISYCDPPIKFRPAVLRYLSKNHNFWHRASLLLEDEMNGPHTSKPAIGIGCLITNDVSQNHLASLVPGAPKQTRSTGSQVAAASQANGPGGDKLVVGSSFLATGAVANIQDLFPSELPVSLCQPYGHECMSALAHIYEILKEQDYWAGIWSRRGHYNETLTAIAYEQQGFFEQAKGAYELAMSKGANDYSSAPIPYWLRDEYALWENHWIRCSKELNQWDFLLEYGSTPQLANPLLVLESAWRIPDWKSMSKAVTLVEQNLPKDFAWKLALYKGYNSLCNPDNRDMEVAERMVEVATNFLLKEWRRLPHIVSSAHINILQGAHQVIELQEAFNLHQILFSQNNPMYGHDGPGSNLRSVIKTWKNRLPIVADDLSHWSDIFTWRQHHYQAIVTRFEQELKLQQQQGNNTSSAASNALCGAHASAQSLIHLAKVARKHFLINVALDQLNRIHTIPKVPIVDCFQKIRQQLKCYLLKHAVQPSGEELQEAMSVIDCTHLHFFQTEMMAEFIAFKGYVLMKMDRMEEANKNLSVSLQLLDTLVNGWAMWAEYNYEMFMASVRESFAQRNMQHGINAIISFLHAARHQNEAKARKFLSHVLWLLSYDQENKFAKTIEQYNLGVPIYNWVPWIQQLLHCLIGSEGQMMLSIVLQISKHYPEAVYFPTRTMYLTLKMEQREKNQVKVRFALLSSSVGINSQQSGSGAGGSQQPSNDQVPASSGMWRCSRIMHHQRDFHPALLTSIEGILDQLSWFREISWFEELLRQLRQMLVKCYAIAFENRNNVAETVTSHHTFNYIRKLVSTFGIGIDNGPAGGNLANKGRAPMSTTASETLARRAQSTVQDPDFQKMKQQFANDFDFSVQGSRKLHNMIIKLKKWIKILEAKTKTLPKSWLLEEKCRYLSNFSQQIADVALPGEYFLPKNSSIVHIARFMPRVEVINKHNTSARRLYIRGHNGKIYPYLVLNDSSPGEVRREERFLHLLRLLNLYLTKHKETARRVLNFTVPRVVPITGQMRFVEDNVSSLSLLEIYKQHMIRRGSDPDAPIAKYYDRLLSLQTKGSQVSLNQLKDIISDIQVSMAPKTLLREWAMQTFSTATEFWHFRKSFTLQLGLACLLEYAFHLTRLNPDMMYIHRDSGLVNIAYYRFDLKEETGELVSNQPVPFRVTHSVQNLVTDIGISGPLTATMIATASCLVHPNYKVRSILHAIFRDEIIVWHKRVKANEKIALISAAITALANQSAKNSQQQANKDSMDTDQQQQQQLSQHQHLVDMINSPNFNDIPEITAEELVTSVTKAVNAIMSRMKNLAMFEGTDSSVATLINKATNADNLCRMDPAWHPWL